jgi:two-component system, LytTR family, sensor kinase
LTIRLILEKGNYLKIENTIQEKSSIEKSTKVGLQNIINRYNLMTSKKIEIINDNQFFSVKIPLLTLHEPNLVVEI